MGRVAEAVRGGGVVHNEPHYVAYLCIYFLFFTQ